MSPGEKSNAIENRLKKDIDNLKREKKILLEDTEVGVKILFVEGWGDSMDESNLKVFFSHFITFGHYC